MNKTTKFFQCFSINLHNFLRAGGLRPMHRSQHDKGIDILDDSGKWNSYQRIADAIEDGYDKDEIEEVLEILEGEEKAIPYEHSNGEIYRKRIRVYWVYKIDKDLEDLLIAWNRTKPEDI
mgnify:CR=1 FL=1